MLPDHPSFAGTNDLMRYKLGGAPIHSYVQDVEMDELQKLATDKICCEIGSEFGYSTVGIASVAKHLVSIEPCLHYTPTGEEIARKNVRDYGFIDKVTFCTDYSYNILPQYIEVFDFIFIDGDHSEASVEQDATLALAALKPGGVIACHDRIPNWPGVVLALDKVLGEPDYQIFSLAVFSR